MNHKIPPNPPLEGLGAGSFAKGGTKNNENQSCHIGWVLCVGFLVSTTAFALSKDKNEPIYLEADSVHIDDAAGISTYTGSVKYTQGTISLLADKATLKNGDAGIEHITATGKPAIYTELPDEQDAPVTAKGNTIDYDAAKETVVLTDNASVEQKNDLFKAPLITYFRVTKVVESQGGRSYILIHPENHKSKDKK